MSRSWMPLYVADYLADTAHLNAAESGAYLHLIMHYWQTGGLPDDDRKLSRIAKLTDKEWAKARKTLVDFFEEGWRHARIDHELEEAREAYQRRANAGRKGGNAKTKPEQCSSNAQALPKQSQSQESISSLRSEIGPAPEAKLGKPFIPEKPVKRAKGRSQLAADAQPSLADGEHASTVGMSRDEFKTEWQRFRDHHRAKGSLMADWSAAWRTWVGNWKRFSHGPPRAGASAPRNTFLQIIEEQIQETRQDTRQETRHEFDSPHETILVIDIDANSGPHPSQNGDGGGSDEQRARAERDRMDHLFAPRPYARPA